VRLFLDEIYDRRLKVLSYINNSGQPKSVKEIATATDFANRTVSMIVRQFEQELDVSEKEFKVHYVNRTIKSVSASNLDLNGIGRDYLVQSTMYKIVKHIFLSDKLDVTKFCEAKFISAATFSRQRKKIKDILKKCGLGLSRENRIIGDEFKIRNFFFLFFFNSSNMWEFSKQEQTQIINYFSQQFDWWEELDSVKQLKMTLLVYISLVRSRQKNFAEDKTLMNLTKKRMNTLNVKILYGYFSSVKNKTIGQVWAETSATLYFFYKENIHYEPLELEKYEDYFSKEHFPFVKQSEKLSNRIVETFFDETSNQELYLNIRKEIDLFYLNFDICFIDHKIFYYIYDEDNFYHIDKLEAEMKEKLLLILNQLNIYEEGRIFTGVEKETVVDYLYLIVYTLQIKFKSVDYTPVKVFIQNTKLFVSNILAKKLKLFFGDRIECVEILTSDVDIIVTDVHMPTQKNHAEQIYVATFSDLSDTSFLIEQIQNKLIEKYAQRKMHLQKT